MKCHLLRNDRFKSKDEVKFTHVEDFVNSDHFDLYLCKCEKCEQLYIGCFIEICSFTDDDDCWNFWLPVKEEDIKAIRKDHSIAIKLIQRRKHITWHPDGTVDWCSGREIALIRGPG